jgi:hypothetical protein
VHQAGDRAENRRDGEDADGGIEAERDRDRAGEQPQASKRDRDAGEGDALLRA